MPVPPGARLGPYEVLALIGAGGMGEVYKARDTRLDRTVALKILPPEFCEDPDRRARFEREAKAISQLSHPHICGLFDVGDAELPRAHPSTGSEWPELVESQRPTSRAPYLVMEHLQGQTLAQRLTRGPLPLNEALRIGTEIADALAVAHRHGVIHRDLKPSNVMLARTDGSAGPPTVKLLDFGLAKVCETSTVAETSAGPTRTVSKAGEGMPVGTLPYMAPEQVEGKPTDARTDIWALGCVLYEMVTGARAFAGNSQASLIASILGQDPAPLPEREPLTPPVLDRAVRKCLAKAPEDRWDGAHDLADELRWISRGGTTIAIPTISRRRRVLRAAPAVVCLIAVAAIGTAIGWVLRSPESHRSLVRVSLEVLPAEELNAGGSSGWLPTPGGSGTALTWAPNGQALVFVGRRDGVQQLYVRRLDAAEAQPLSGTEGARVPAVSPDGQWVAFWARGKIRKVPLDGGPVMDLASADAELAPWGLVWSADGGLLFGDRGGSISEILSAGAVKAVTTVPKAASVHGLPWLLPGGQVMLFTLRRSNRSWGDEEIVAQRLTTGERKLVLRDAADARYLPTGHLVFLRRGRLFAVTFDADRLEVRGPEVALVDSVAQALIASNANDLSGAGQFAISETGTLAWVRGGVPSDREGELVAVDRRGHVTSLSAPVRSYGPSLRLSPDGRRLVVTVRSLTEVSLFLYDLVRGALTPLVRDGEVASPQWWPDGRRVAFTWLKNARMTLAAQVADGSEPPQVLMPLDGSPSSFTPDGRQLAVAPFEPGMDLMIVTVGEAEPGAQPWVKTPDDEAWPEFSPDGHWLAYGSDVSGRFEVYVRSYPDPGAVYQVSVEGGASPAWHPNGRALFFLGPTDASGKGRMMTVDVDLGVPLRFGRPHPLFEFDRKEFPFLCSAARCYDVGPDGERFYVVRWLPLPPPPVVTHINLIQDWFEELKAKVPTGG